MPETAGPLVAVVQERAKQRRTVTKSYAYKLAVNELGGLTCSEPEGEDVRERMKALTDEELPVYSAMRAWLCRKRQEKFNGRRLCASGTCTCEPVLL
mmetsp:Transcript_24736/g.80885  ORF Transcript_24736/g.80885 Transcript_24736/m.80885 type:complete len:97 (-) Transcript_24736:347-637(-)